MGFFNKKIRGNMVFLGEIRGQNGILANILGMKMLFW
jgi:hypothetical protein